MGCNACQYGKPCIQKDGFSELVPKVKAADLIVFASLLLFRTISAKLKAFIERFYCITEEDENPPLGRYEKYPVKDTALLRPLPMICFGHMSRQYRTTNLQSSTILDFTIKECGKTIYQE